VKTLISILTALLLFGCTAKTKDADVSTKDSLEPETAVDVSTKDLPGDQGTNWPGCPGWTGMSLHEKARRLDELVRKQHLPDGLLRSVILDEKRDVKSLLHLPSTGLWTAIYLASQSFRWAVTGEKQALDNARTAVKGLHHLTMVTGRPGLYGRAYARQGFSYAQDVDGVPGWVKSQATGYDGWYFNSDVSKDTMDGIMFGYAVAMDLLKDETLLTQVRQDLLTFVNAFVDAGLRIIDYNGKVTEHGRLFYSALDDLPGFNALLTLSWVRSGVFAESSVGGYKLKDFYRHCLLREGDGSDCPKTDTIDLGSYLDVVERQLGVYRKYCKTSYDNIDMVFQAIYPLLRFETDPDVRKMLLAVLHDEIWDPPPEIAVGEPPVHRSTHSLYISMYGALASPSHNDPVFTRAMMDAVCTLYELPLDRSDRYVAAGTQKPACTNRMGLPNAADVIPLDQRYYDNYLWRLDPYEIPQEHQAVPGLVHSPEDFLLAYWMGRYFGLLDESM